MDQEEIDRLNLNYATEALDAFTRFARRIKERSHGQEEPILILFEDGSGHIEDKVSGKDYGKAFSSLAYLVERLEK